MWICPHVLTFLGIPSSLCTAHSSIVLHYRSDPTPAMHWYRSGVTSVSTFNVWRYSSIFFRNLTTKEWEALLRYCIRVLRFLKKLRLEASAVFIFLLCFTSHLFFSSTYSNRFKLKSFLYKNFSQFGDLRYIPQQKNSCCFRFRQYSIDAYITTSFK